MLALSECPDPVLTAALVVALHRHLACANHTLGSCLSYLRVSIAVHQHHACAKRMLWSRLCHMNVGMPHACRGVAEKVSLCDLILMDLALGLGVKVFRLAVHPRCNIRALRVAMMLFLGLDARSGRSTGVAMVADTRKVVLGVI